MNFSLIKEALDRFYAQLNEPHGVVPQWSEAGLTSEAIAGEESRLGVLLPADMRQALTIFSGISHETPLSLGAEFPSLQKQIIKKSGGELSWDDFQDDLEICQIFSPESWNLDESRALRLVDVEILESTEAQERIAVQADLEWLSNERFVLVGSTYSQSLYLNLMDETAASYGSFYNYFCPYPFVVLYPVANSYTDLLGKVVSSLELKVKSLD